MSLVSRLAIVTGGGTGIGRATCQAFASEGASVAVVGNIRSDVEDTAGTLKEIAEKSGHKDSKFIPFEVDVSDSSQVNAMFESLATSFGEGSPPLSVIVNAAGIHEFVMNSIVQQTEQSFDKVIDVNLKGTFLMTQGAAKAMIESKVGNGSIINISSIVAKTGKTSVTYTASKGGVFSMTLTCARELGRNGIRCNAILPGFIDTPIIATVPQAMKDAVISTTFLGRIGKPKEVAELCVFLASDKSSYITGSCIEITGGGM